MRLRAAVDCQPSNRAIKSYGGSLCARLKLDSVLGKKKKKEYALRGDCCLSRSSSATQKLLRAHQHPSAHRHTHTP